MEFSKTQSSNDLLEVAGEMNDKYKTIEAQLLSQEPSSDKQFRGNKTSAEEQPRDDRAL